MNIIKVGTVIETPGMNMRVNGMGGTWIRFEYWDKIKKEWRPRGYTEKKTTVEENIASGAWREIK